MTSRETPEQKRARIHKAETRKIRRLSGWNVFQRQSMEGLTLKADEYKDKVQELSRRWKSLSPEEKARFQIDADYQQSQLDSLARTPLPPSKDKGLEENSMEGAEGVWRNARKKLSCRRLALNTQGFEQHSLWDLPTQLGDSRSDLILGNKNFVMPTF